MIPQLWEFLCASFDYSNHFFAVPELSRFDFLDVNPFGYLHSDLKLIHDAHLQSPVRCQTALCQVCLDYHGQG